MTNIAPTSHICMHEPKVRLEPDHGVCDISGLLEMSSIPNYLFLEKVITDKAVIYKEDMSETLRKLGIMNTNHSL